MLARLLGLGERGVNDSHWRWYHAACSVCGQPYTFYAETRGEIHDYHMITPLCVKHNRIPWGKLFGTPGTVYGESEHRPDSVPARLTPPASKDVVSGPTIYGTVPKRIPPYRGAMDGKPPGKHPTSGSKEAAEYDAYWESMNR